jgi:hypothetical protein
MQSKFQSKIILPQSRSGPFHNFPEHILSSTPIIRKRVRSQLVGISEVLLYYINFIS